MFLAYAGFVSLWGSVVHIHYVTVSNVHLLYTFLLHTISILNNLLLIITWVFLKFIMFAHFHIFFVSFNNYIFEIFYYQINLDSIWSNFNLRKIDSRHAMNSFGDMVSPWRTHFSIWNGSASLYYLIYDLLLWYIYVLKSVDIDWAYALLLHWCDDFYCFYWIEGFLVRDKTECERIVVLQCLLYQLVDCM